VPDRRLPERSLTENGGQPHAMVWHSPTMALFVLIHSPSVGPRTWFPVASRLTDAGCQVIVPSLLGIGEGSPPFWPRVAAAVSEQLAAAPEHQSLVLVAHSNAGVFIPVIRRAVARPVQATVLVDASMPAADGLTPVAGSEFLPFLRGLADANGRLPPWTQWWDEPDVAALFPDAKARGEVTAEEPRLPLAYYEEQVPVPRGWDDHPCGYLVFGSAYDSQADEARRRGWTVRSLPGAHLHQIVDPAGVARILLEIAGAVPP
jgi:hypothetical protein